MPRKTNISLEQQVRDAALPPKPDSSIVSHGFVIDKTREILLAKGFTIEREFYRCNLNGSIAQGMYHLKEGNDPEVKMMFSWTNCYDKTMKFKCSFGGYVLVSLSSVISDINNLVKKFSTMNAEFDITTYITSIIEQGEHFYNHLCLDKELMKTIFVSPRQRSEILGRLYFENELLSNEQIGIIKSQILKPVFNYNAPIDSLWVLYNHIIYSLQISHPKQWMEQQKVVHYIITKDSFNVSPEPPLILTEGKPEEFKDPAQLNLIDAITEIESEKVVDTSIGLTLKEGEITPEMIWGEGKVEKVKEVIIAHSEGRTREFTDEDGIRTIEVIEPKVESFKEGNVVIKVTTNNGLKAELPIQGSVILPDDFEEVVEEPISSELIEEVTDVSLETAIDKPEDFWFCIKCGEKQGAHKLWNNGKCEECTEDKKTSANL